MSQLSKKLRAFLGERLRPKPASAGEWFWMRLLFACVVAYTFNDTRPYGFESQPAPVGIAYILPLQFLSFPGVREAILGIVGIALLCYVLNRGLRWALLALTICSILTNTLLNSQGFVLHAYQIVTLTLLGQTILAFHHQSKRGSAFSEALKRSQFVFYSQGIVLGTYVVAALSKVINSRGQWLWNSKYLSGELIKSHRQVYYQKLDPALAEDIGAAVWLKAHPFLSQVIFGSGFFLELLALAALLGRWWALGIGLSLIAMHRGIYTLMRLEFPFNELLVLIFLVNLPYWFWWRKRSNLRPL